MAKPSFSHRVSNAENIGDYKTSDVNKFEAGNFITLEVEASVSAEDLMRLDPVRIKQHLMGLMTSKLISQAQDSGLLEFVRVHDPISLDWRCKCRISLVPAEQAKEYRKQKREQESKHALG
jgi:hypothetical protein